MMVAETPEGGLSITFSRADLTAMPQVDERILKSFVSHMFDVCADPGGG